MKIKKTIQSWVKSFFPIPFLSRIGFTSAAYGASLRRRGVEQDPVGNYAGWVYAAISKRAKRIGAINLKLMEMLRDGSLNEIDDHELLALLYRANPMQSMYQFFYMIEVMLGIWGTAPVYIDRAGGKRIQYLWPLRPDYVKTLTNDSGQITGYVYKVGTQTLNIKKEDIVPINEPNPQNIALGMSPLQAAGLEVDTDTAEAIWNKTLLENFGEPGGILRTDQELEDDEFERLRTEWQIRQAGTLNAGRTAILEKGLEYTPIGRSPKDLDTIESRKFHRNAIVTILGVPMGIMTSEDVNLANAEVAERVFARDTIEPQMKLIVGQLNEFLVPLFADNLWLDFESPIPDDVQQKINIASAGEGRWLTVNEARDIFSMPALDGGDAIFKPIGVMPQVEGQQQKGMGFEVIKVKRTNKEPAKYAEIRRNIKARTWTRREFAKGMQEKVYSKVFSMIQGAKQDVKVKIKGAKASVKEEGAQEEGAWMSERQKADRNEFLSRLPIKQNEARQAFKNFFKQQEKIVLENLKEEGLPKKGPRGGIKSNLGRWINKIIFDGKEQDEILLNVSGDIYRSNIEEGAKAVAKLLGLDPSDILASPFVISFIHDKSFGLLSVNQTTKEALRATMAEGISAGEGLEQIRQRITNVYSEASGFRSEMIARTEVGSAQNFGRSSEMENQKVGKQVWIASFSNTRDAHAEADGQVTNVGEPFIVGGEQLDYPGDPSGSPENIINCQCQVSPTLDR